MKTLRRLASAIPRRIARVWQDNSPFPKCLRSWLSNAGPLKVIDVGANHGHFIGALARHYQLARGWLVEPQQALADELRRAFQPPKYSVHRLAIADRKTEMTLEVMRGAPETASLLPIKSGLPQFSHIPLGQRDIETCPVDTLDGFAAEAGVEDVDMLKLDTQGTELQALSGGRDVLARTRALWIELSFRQLYVGGCLIHEVVEFTRDE
jgi:FkbM family methyltransferase